MSSGTPSRIRLALEYGVLFFGLPVVFVLDRFPLPLFPSLWLLAAGCLIWLLRSPEFSARRLWSLGSLNGHLLKALAPVVAGVPLILVATWVLLPERLFGFVRERPAMWALVMVLYPLLSVLPQGVVYRVFIFRRYRRLFPARGARIAASAAAFSAVHIVFENWIAPAFTLAGGALFAWTYDRSQSELPAAVQHALFGCTIFTVGLGWYFYAGAVR
ncbi:MAG: CPBP family intramembrane metalloprotease [Acidobacteria bacterium]|nr:CPBP family intramembrane metalloprotease [Acidobacteriota bacterium]NIM63890.1 CPBP family intramembrane metalloprotease [Acidobacteriota bacterium]NIO60159.1 CPBP family intramembrane metalloprotease [Acidobacteriota bacterium]NIQ31223.1 CPBP family intramembrane metalloprotease [Acidobacteriota bacterium]NIQ86360.1 CPBP family intramembrane metalloprotease [Acidobacteriota bacterium]